MDTEGQIPARSPGEHMLHGSAWMILLRWGIRLTGLISTIVLARLLTPADFGIVAMATIVVGMLETLGYTGQKLAIIQHEDPSREHYDAAWTLSVLQGFAIAAIILLVAPLTPVYFHEPRAIPVMQCLALRSAIGGFENIGTTNFRRHLRFDRFFFYNMYPKLISFVVAISFAIWLRNYWALVAGIFASQLSLTVLSFTMNSYRPRFSLRKLPDLWSFSLWTFVGAIGTYFNALVDQIAIGGVVGATLMGRYAVAEDLATSPSREINEPMIGVLLPVMARLQGNVQELRALYLRAIEWSALICISTSVGVAIIARCMVPVVLGSKWLAVEPLISWLALAAGILGVSSGTYSLFVALGKAYLAARMQWLRLVMLAATIFPVAFVTHSLMAVAMSRLAVIVVFVPTLFLEAGRMVGITAGDYLRIMWRPFLAAGAMAVAVWTFNYALPLPNLPELLADMALGVMAFGSTIIALWILSGRPPSAEHDVYWRVQAGWKRFRVRWASGFGYNH